MKVLKTTEKCKKKNRPQIYGFWGNEIVVSRWWNAVFLNDVSLAQFLVCRVVFCSCSRVLSFPFCVCCQCWYRRAGGDDDVLVVLVPVLLAPSRHLTAWKSRIDSCCSICVLHLGPLAAHHICFQHSNVPAQWKHATGREVLSNNAASCFDTHCNLASQ